VLCHRVMEQDRPVRDRYRVEEQGGVDRVGAVRVARLLDPAGNASVPSAGRKPPTSEEHPAFSKSARNAGPL
jgi:hypothetical protein